MRNSPLNVQNVITYDVVIDADNADLALRPGMTANVDIVTGRREQVLRVPTAALRFRPPAGERRPPRRPPAPPYGTLSGGRPGGDHRDPAGLADDSYTEVQAGGLAEGDAVIVSVAADGARAQAPARSVRPASTWRGGGRRRARGRSDGCVRTRR